MKLTRRRPPTPGMKLTRRTKETASSRGRGWWTRARPALVASPERRGTTSATLSTDVTMMVAAMVAEDVAAAGARCVDVAVEAKEVVVAAAVEVEKEAVVARGTSTGSLATTELESRLRTSEEAVARATGEPSRTMCPRRARRRTPPWTPRARTKLPPKRNQRHQESSPLKSWRQRLPGKRRRSR